MKIESSSIDKQNIMLSYNEIEQVCLVENEIKQVCLAENETEQVCLAKNGIEQVCLEGNELEHLYQTLYLSSLAILESLFSFLAILVAAPAS